ncbi:MAG: peptidase domain-containing ABC transporter [Gammaproteobacteria bacterium]|nr:peptidase domain-containing ABC transporter [Gammaproteobacteria bacterium]
MESRHTPTPTRPEALLHFGGGRRLPVILQAEATECGLACLAMIAGYHGYETDLVTLRQRFAISSRGSNLKALINIAGRMQLSSRALRLEVEQTGALQAPAILHWDLNHFVVLKRVTRQHIEIHNPASGVQRLDKTEFARHFTGVALELLPTDAFQPGQETKKLRLGQFWTRIQGLKRSFGQVLLLALLLQLFAIVSPFYLQLVVDDVLLRHDGHLLIVLALGFGLLLLIQVGTSALREYVILYLSNRLGFQMAANLFRHLVRLPMDYFHRRHLGDVVSRFGSLNAVQNLLTTGLIAAIVDGILALVTVSVMLAYSVTLTLVVLGVVVLYAAIRIALYRTMRGLTEGNIVARAKLDTHFMETIRAMQTIKLFQRENDRQGQWHNFMADAMNRGIAVMKWNVWYGVLNDLLTGIENLVVIYLGARAVMGNAMTVGMLYAFISYKTRFVGSIGSLINKAIELRMLEVHLGRVADIVFTPAEPVDEQVHADFVTAGGRSAHGDLLRGKIEVRNLCHRYSDTDGWVFANLNFVIQPGETVAMTGPSGCGKTTLLKCLLGLIQPTLGEILIDDLPLARVPHYRSQSAGVMQEDRLLSGSLADNIACFSSEPDLERVTTCARQACIHAEIMAMPMQYQTLVGDMGSSLSGGQYQRLLLARALYRAPRILYLDEATSHLDLANEAGINHQIRQLAITRVIVAHRPETIALASREINLAGRPNSH